MSEDTEKVATGEVIVQSNGGAPAPLTPAISTLLDRFADGIQQYKRAGTPIHADEIASRIAKFYELIRKVIDWKEDNVLRRSAIERNLKRLLFSKISGLSFTGGISADRVAEKVTVELIRGGHLPNDEVPREIIPEVSASVSKYISILERTKFSPVDPLAIKTKINFYTFILELAACEIEELVVRPFKENALIEVMTKLLDERVKIIPSDYLTDDDKKIKLYIATCRTLYDLDDAFIIYHLLAFQYPNWHKPDSQLMEHLTTHMMTIWKESEQILSHPLSKQFYAIAENIDTVFTLLGDVLDTYKENPEVLYQSISQKSKLKEAMGEAYDKRYITLKTRLTHLAIFSTLSVFLSNGITYYLIEVPLASAFYEGFNIFTTIIDFLIPTAVMALLVSIIRPPPKENQQRVIQTALSFVYADERTSLYEIYAKRTRRPIITTAVSILYLCIMFLVFGSIGWVFYISKLPMTSVVFDTMTIALTVFAAVGIRNKAKELTVNDRSTIWEFFLDMISVPVAKVGSFFAAKWKEYNIISIFFNFVVETPFNLIVNFIEQWSQYLKERRAELH